MPKISVWIHLIWSTKYRNKTLTKELRELVFRHIRENAHQKNIRLECIGGAVDHVHVLVRPRPDQSIARLAQMIKGESSHWVNEQKLTRLRFEWQDEYMAVSVSPYDLPRVRSYIRNQEEHHRSKSFAEILQRVLGNSDPLRGG